jgi:hypothetical protein
VRRECVGLRWWASWGGLKERRELEEGSRGEELMEREA